VDSRVLVLLPARIRFEEIISLWGKELEIVGEVSCEKLKFIYKLGESHENLEIQVLGVENLGIIRNYKFTERF